MLKVIARKAPTLKDKLFKRKALALRPNQNFTQPCSNFVGKRRGPRCMCCSMISQAHQITCNGKTVKTAGGSCKSNNIIYCVLCKLCYDQNCYVGNSGVATWWTVVDYSTTVFLTPPLKYVFFFKKK